MQAGDARPCQAKEVSSSGDEAKHGRPVRGGGLD